MRYVDFIYKTRTPSEQMHFMKLADAQKRKEPDTLKDIALVGGGTALGAGLGYGTAALLKKRYGKGLRGAAPDSRLKYLVPVSAGLGGAAALTHVLRQRAESRSKKKK